ncbi:MAG: hypothetical protein H0V40_07145 [Actinobacteria bacterium]|nr:hypothetical protein [Actinomycetota bacterium]
MGGASAVLRAGRTHLGATGLIAALAAYGALAGSLPELPLGWDVLLVALALLPATFALVLLALPLRLARGLFAVGIALALLAVACSAAELDVAANLAKIAAASALGFVFCAYFERASWVVVIAAIIPLVDSLSVWRGPTHEIVSDRPEVFGALSIAFPVPDDGSFQLGLPDVLFFAIFLAATARWELRVLPTWLAMVASFGATMALAVWVDPFDLGGLPALPLLSLAFLAVNADRLWAVMREPAAGPAESPGT